MRRTTMLIIAGVLIASASAHSQSFDEDLRVYAVGVVNVAPFKGHSADTAFISAIAR